MWYAIWAEDVPDSLPLRLQAREKHLQRLHHLRDEGRLMLAGPLPAVDAAQPEDAGFTGSLIVAEFGDEQAAREWADADPYRAAGVYARVTVKPFKPVLP